MLDGSNSFYSCYPGAPGVFQYTGRFRVIDPAGTVLQIGYNCRWYWLQGQLILRSRETDNILNQWTDPSQLLKVVPWPEKVYDSETWDEL